METYLSVVAQRPSGRRQRGLRDARPHAAALDHLDGPRPRGQGTSRLFNADFYRRRYATERQQHQFMTLMADPIHPNALGYRALADALVPIACPLASGGQ